MVPVAASSVENATVVVPDAVPGVARVVSATAMAENVARAVTGEAEFQTVVMRDPVASVAPGPRPDRVGGVDLAPVALAADPVRGALAVVSAVPVTAVARPLVRRVDERAAGVDAVAPAGRPFRVGEVVADAVRPGDSDVTGEVAARPGVVEPAPEWHAAQMAGQPPAMPAREEGRAPLAGGGPHVAAGDAGLRPVLADEEVPAPLRQFAAALAESPGDGGEGERHVRLRLRPASLGELDVRITSGLDDGARVAIAATRPETLSLLRADMAGLRQTLAEAGLHVSEANLTFVLRPAEALAAPADPAPGLGGHLPDVGVEAARPATPATGPNLGPNLGSHLDQGMRAQNDFGFGQGGNADPGARRFGQHPATPRGAEAGAAWDEPIVATSPSPGRSGGGLDITA